MAFMDKILLIWTAALCVWGVGHMWIHSFFDRKVEIIEKLRINIEEGV